MCYHSATIEEYNKDLKELREIKILEEMIEFIDYNLGNNKRINLGLSKDELEKILYRRLNFLSNEEISLALMSSMRFGKTIPKKILAWKKKKDLEIRLD